MLDKLLSVVATNAKLVVAGAAGAALVAGGGAVAVTQVSHTSGAQHASAATASQTDDNRSETATAKIALPKPSDSSEAAATTADAGTDGAQGDHGACVSAVAQSPTPDGAASNAHGKAVSEAARVTCKTGNDTADAARKAAADRKATGQSHQSDHATGSGDDANEAPDTEAPETDGTDGSGSNHSGGHGKSGQTHP